MNPEKYLERFSQRTKQLAENRPDSELAQQAAILEVAVGEDYSKQIDKEVVARLQTRMAAFSDPALAAMAYVVISHEYLSCAAETER